ncbi:hypothetical protein K488DRAFT_52919 [Vararia minispora EC-137]|uniref:Uncharacterized protein n=1 Tax=Vararia minispora EC-137 TaxID=1314806 RepID=A0ACB8QHD0_9AGAM|nr:hypothetical protein K488DRAFT_52919 [Vararia minispora EC-137]
MATTTHIIYSDYDPTRAKAQGDPPQNVASWYKSLQRTQPHTASTTTTNIPSVLVSPPIASSSNLPAELALSASKPKKGAGNDPTWFISRALDTPSSVSPAPAPSTSLAEILAREPPSARAPHRPPVFLHLPPDNRGWVMLQNQGWSEGEALGSSRCLVTTPKRPDGIAPPKKSGRKESVKHEDVSCGPDVDIVEVKHTPVVDLTFESDSEDDVIGSELREDVSDFTSGNDGAHAAAAARAGASGGVDGDARGGQRALLTPLPTVLKADRLGIGLKAKMAGPFRQSVKRVTHNAAALSMHMRAAEETRRTKNSLGRGRRAFARIDRAEQQARQDLLAYMNS